VTVQRRRRTAGELEPAGAEAAARLLRTRPGARHGHETVTPASRLTHGEAVEILRSFLDDLD
jgi:hypothetical protein